VVPEDAADGRAGLVVGRQVGQFVVIAEGFAPVAGAQPAGQRHLLVDDILPQGLDRGEVLLIAGQGGDIGHGGVHVHRPHGVADRLPLLDNRQMILHVAGVAKGPHQLPPVRAPALIQEELGQVEIFLLPGQAVQLDQPQLHLLMPRHGVQGVRAEDPADQVGGAPGDIQEGALAGGLVVGDRALKHVAEVVQLVAHEQVRPAGRAGGLRRMLRVDRPRGVEVAVRLLGGGDLLDDAVDVSFQRRIRLHLQGVGRPFDHLENIRVVELVADVGAGHLAGGFDEVSDAPGFLTLLEIVGDRHLPVGLDARQPEGILNAHPGKRDGLKGVL